MEPANDGGVNDSQAASASRRGALLVFSGAVCISFSGFFVRDAPMDSSAVAFYRLFFGGATLFLIACVQRVRIVPHRQNIGLMLAAAAFFACDIILWHKSILDVGPGIATILSNFQVIFLAVYSVLFLKEKMGWPQKISIPLALVGLVLLVGLHQKVIPGNVVSGVATGVLSALFYTGYILTLRRTQSIPVKLTPVANIAWVSLFCCGCIAVFCVGTGASLVIPDVRTGLILVALGVLCQSLGWFLLSLGLPRLPPFRAGLIMLTQPALAFVWDVIFLGTVTDVVNILGAVLAIGAIGLGLYAPGKR